MPHITVTYRNQSKSFTNLSSAWMFRGWVVLAYPALADSVRLTSRLRFLDGTHMALPF